MNLTPPTNRKIILIKTTGQFIDNNKLRTNEVPIKQLEHLIGWHITTYVGPRPIHHRWRREGNLVRKGICMF